MTRYTLLGIIAGLLALVSHDLATSATRGALAGARVHSTGRVTL